MTELAMVDVVGAWLGIFLTICILSFLYGDNPFYKLAEHLFVGVSVGYIVVLQLGSNFYVKLERGLTWWDAVPLVLVAMLFAKLASRRLGWLGKFPLAFVVALFAGQSIVGLVGSDLADQMKVAARPLVVERVDLNTAGAPELSLLPGVSPAVAGKLVAERAGRPFESLEDALARPSLTADERAELAAQRGHLVGLDARAAVRGGEVVGNHGGVGGVSHQGVAKAVLVLGLGARGVVVVDQDLRLAERAQSVVQGAVGGVLEHGAPAAPGELPSEDAGRPQELTGR
jgi:hypothetical protein